MKMTASMAGFRINFTRVKRKLEQEFNKTLDEAIKAWVQTAESIIPRWSGASRGTLVELGNQVGVNVSAFPIPGVQNRVAQGRAATTTDIQRGPTRWTFTYSSDLFHLAINERFDVSDSIPLKQPGPYMFRQQANRAAQQVIRERINRQPPGSILQKNVRPLAIRSK